jgi:hypothetical protein
LADPAGWSLLQYGNPVQNQSVQRSLAGKATTDLAFFKKRGGCEHDWNKAWQITWTEEHDFT